MLICQLKAHYISISSISYFLLYICNLLFFIVCCNIVFLFKNFLLKTKREMTTIDQTKIVVSLHPEILRLETTLRLQY